MAGTILQEGGRDAGAGFGCGRVPEIAAAGAAAEGGAAAVSRCFAPGAGGAYLTKGCMMPGAIFDCGRMPEIAAAGAAERGMVR